MVFGICERIGFKFLVKRGLVVLFEFLRVVWGDYRFVSVLVGYLYLDLMFVGVFSVRIRDKGEEVERSGERVRGRC